MMKIISFLISAVFPLIKVLFPQFKFNPVGNASATDAFVKIKDALETKTIPVLKKMSGKSLPVERINQYLINEVNKEYSCQYTCYCTGLPVMTGKKLIPEKYDDVCKSMGAMRDDFWILDHDKMLVAGGLNGYRTEQVPVVKSSLTAIIQRVIESINAGAPVIASLGGKHYQLVSGYEPINDELLLKITDPGGWNDTHMETSTMRVFKFDKNGNRIYSSKSGVQRVVTSFRFIVKV